MRLEPYLPILLSDFFSFVSLIAIAQGLGDPCTSADGTVTGVTETCTSGQSSSLVETQPPAENDDSRLLPKRNMQ